MIMTMVVLWKLFK